MNYFEDDGIDNHKQVEKMLEHALGLESAFMGLSKPLQQYFGKEFAFAGVDLSVALFHLATSVEAFAELMGVEEVER